MQQPPLWFLSVVSLLQRLMPCYLIFISLFYLCNKLKNAICLFLYSSGFIPTHTPCTHSFQLSKECDAFICGSAQTLVYQCIHPVWERDIGAIWKSHLTHTAWDKWEKNLCCSRAPCKELFLKIVLSFGFITL